MMNTKSKNIWYYYEKFKAFLLVFFMILCIVQVGILWSSQSGSFPISFLTSLFSDSKVKAQTSIEDSKGDYLLPYRVVLSTGFNGDHYLIPNGSPEYTAIWNGAKLYLTEALDTKPKQTQAFTEEAWGNLVANKPYTFEFKTQIPVDIMKGILSINRSAGEGISSIYKIVICPDDPDYSYADTLFIRDDKNIYTYELPDLKIKALDKEEFAKFYTQQESSSNSKNYEMAFEKYSKNSIKITKDMLAPFSTKSTERYASIICKPFVESLSDYNGIAKKLFGEAINGYDPDEDANGSAVFKKKDSIYKLYQNSVLEYRFIGDQGIYEKTKVLEAYKNAIVFIMEHNRQSNFMSGISIYLKSIDEGQNSYIFNFDYNISLGDGNGEVPILMKNYEIPNSDKQIENSISIEATSKMVIHCEWIALEFMLDKTMTYQWTFPNMHANVFNAYPELEKQELSADGFGIYYILSYPKTHGHVINPSFVLFTKNGTYDILMKGNNN